MIEQLKNYYLKLWRLQRKDFFIKHLRLIPYLIIVWIISSFILLTISWSVNKLIHRICFTLILSVIVYFILKSNSYLAKRFQDCWITGIIVFFIRTIPSIRMYLSWLLYIFNYNVFDNDLLLIPTILSILILYTYPIILIIMCFIKWDTWINKFW